MSDSEMTIPMDRHQGNGDQHIQNGPTFTSNTGLEHGICYPVKTELIDPCEFTDSPTRDNQNDSSMDVVPCDIYHNISTKNIKIEQSMLQSSLSTYAMTESTNFETDVFNGQYSDKQTTDHKYNDENIACYREESTCTSREVSNQISHIKQEHYEFIEPGNMAFTDYNGQFSDQVENGNSYNVNQDETPHEKQNTQNLIFQINNESTSETNLQHSCEFSDDANENTEASGQYLVQLEKQNDNTYKCDICNYTTERSASLMLHHLLHESSSLKGHKSKNTKAEIYMCQRCGYKTANLYYLKQHSKIHTAMYVCEECSCRFESRYALGKHKLKYSGEKHYCCGLCSKTAKTALEINAHELKHTGDKFGFKCVECNFCCQTKWELQLHQISHSNERPYTCDLCSYRAKTHMRIQRHKWTHVKEKPYKCDSCTFSAATKSHLRLHKEKRCTHGKPKETRYRCDLCNYSTSSSFYHKRHMMAHNADDRRYKCGICSYSTSGSLRMHMIKHHGDHKPYKCGTCNYSTSSSYDLKRHIMGNHRGDKPHKCNTCNYSTSWLTCLKRHIMKEHTGERPHKCGTCNYATVYPHNLKLHIIRTKHEGKTSLKFDLTSTKSREKFTAVNKRRDIPKTLVSEKPAVSASSTREHGGINPVEKFIKQEVSDDITPIANDSMEQRIEKLSTSASITREHREIHPLEKPIKQEVNDDDPPIVNDSSEQRMETPAASAFITRENREINSAEKPIKQDVSGDNNPKMQRSVVSEKPYKCDICDFSAVRASIVKVHRKIHSGESPVKRGVGNNSAQQFGNSIEQKKTTMGEKPYKCDLCGFGTIHSSILDIHKAIHLEDKN